MKGFIKQSTTIAGILGRIYRAWGCADTENSLRTLGPAAAELFLGRGYTLAPTTNPTLRSCLPVEYELEIRAGM